MALAVDVSLLRTVPTSRLKVIGSRFPATPVLATRMARWQTEYQPTSLFYAGGSCLSTARMSALRTAKFFLIWVNLAVNIRVAL